MIAQLLLNGNEEGYQGAKRNAINISTFLAKSRMVENAQDKRQKMKLMELIDRINWTMDQLDAKQKAALSIDAGEVIGIDTSTVYMQTDEETIQEKVGGDNTQSAGLNTDIITSDSKAEELTQENEGYDESAIQTDSMSEESDLNIGEIDRKVGDNDMTMQTEENEFDGNENMTLSEIGEEIERATEELLSSSDDSPEYLSAILHILELKYSKLRLLNLKIAQLREEVQKYEDILVSREQGLRLVDGTEKVKRVVERKNSEIAQLEEEHLKTVREYAQETKKTRKIIDNLEERD